MYISGTLLCERVYISDILPKRSTFQALYSVKGSTFQTIYSVKGSPFGTFYSGYSKGSSVRTEHPRMVRTRVPLPPPSAFIILNSIGESPYFVSGPLHRVNSLHHILAALLGELYAFAIFEWYVLYNCLLGNLRVRSRGAFVIYERFSTK